MSSQNDPRPCRKCGQAPFIILDRIHVECKECFTESSIRKFRQAIGKSRLIRNNDCLLVAYSGGQSSSALLDMMKSRLDLAPGLEPKFRPSILHIDMQSISCPSSLAEIKSDRSRNLNRLLGALRHRYPDWPIYWTSIETCMVDQDASRYCNYTREEDVEIAGSHLLGNEDAYIEFQKAISQSGDLTDRQKFVTDQCAELINRVASDINLSIKAIDDKLKFVLVGSSATQLANSLLVEVILGHGSAISSTVNISDARPPVPLLRPLRDFSKKEIAFYLRARKIEASTQPNLLTKADRKACIQTITESFLSKLYVDYPSTYNTLLRTGGKLA